MKRFQIRDFDSREEIAIVELVSEVAAAGQDARWPTTYRLALLRVISGRISQEYILVGIFHDNEVRSLSETVDSKSAAHYSSLQHAKGDLERMSASGGEFSGTKFHWLELVPYE